MSIKTRVPGETYEQYMERSGKSSLTRKQEKEWKNNENRYEKGPDLSSGNNGSVITFQVNIENAYKDKLIEEIIKNFNNPKRPRRSGVIV